MGVFNVTKQCAITARRGGGGDDRNTSSVAITLTHLLLTSNANEWANRFGLVWSLALNWCAKRWASRIEGNLVLFLAKSAETRAHADGRSALKSSSIEFDCHWRW